MPEGPEVRSLVDKIRPNIVGLKITNFTKAETYKIKTKNIEILSVPAEITEVSSLGKYILVSTKNSCEYITIVLHLGITGLVNFDLVENTFFSFELSNEKNVVTHLCYNGSSYRAGFIHFIKNSDLPTYFKKIRIGPDLLESALNKWISKEDWINIFNRSTKRNKSICSILLDQSYVCGIGNYLKSDILYLAGIHPERKAKDLSLDEWETLRVKSHETILESYESNGCSFRDFVHSDGDLGLYKKKVYKQKFDDLGNQIKQGITSDGRRSFWVESLQK